MYKIKEIVYEKPEGIECKYLMPDRLDTEKMDILIISVNGVYPPGSAGSSRAKYISVMTMNGIQAFDPDCVILDFREMEYQWGNSLLGVFQHISDLKDAEKEEKEPYFPVLSVFSEKCEPGFLSLVTPTGGDEPDWCFNDIDKAISRGVVLCKEWYNYI